MNKESSWEDSLKTRPSLTLGALKEASASNLFILSPSDTGVMRNGGKRGARFSPQTLTNLFSKMVASPNDRKWCQRVVSEEEMEVEDFSAAQESTVESIKEAIKSIKLENIVHIGGGHDHIYPLVKAYSEVKTSKNIVVVNIDAHLDTRADKHSHSGTPFRQLSESLGARLHIYQVGIHPYANVQENYQRMGSMSLAPNKELKNPADWLIEVLTAHKDDHLILSLDCDGLDQSFMPAVSAPNHNGLSSMQMSEILKVCQSYWQETKQTPVFGLYEYNPVFDNINTTAGRYLVSLIHQFLHP